MRLAKTTAAHADLEQRLAQAPIISVLTVTLEGDANVAPHPDPSAYVNKFSRKYAHRTIRGSVGHNLPQGAPRAFAELSSRSTITE